MNSDVLIDQGSWEYFTSDRWIRRYLNKSCFQIFGIEDWSLKQSIPNGGGSTLVDQILDGLDGKTTIRWRLIQRRFLLLVDYQKLWERGQIDRKYDWSIDRPKSVRLPLIENVYTMTEQRMLYVCTRDRNTRYIWPLAEILVLRSKRAATPSLNLDTPEF